ncbi:MAG: hypothetical protein ACJAUV_000998 [Flavobacteriales bacterium]|jgi:hypothetical protein
MNKKEPWPTKNAMKQIYHMKLWGDNNTPFYSGFGSHDPIIVAPYIAALTSFLSAFKNPLKVCDLGCGDFNVGEKLVKHTQQYIAIDIVEELIAYNQEKFQEKNLSFQCLDIAVDELPAGDCILIRQVLQHLSNAEILRIIPKLACFKYVIVTEHVPEGDFVPNIDIISGQGIRLKIQSGLDLSAPPFHVKAKEEKQLLSVTLNQGHGLIVTTLYQNF